jgi:ABC-type lipoprotein release transport system permease subunit
MIGTSTRYALRSLFRNGRRTLLSIVGLAFGVGIGLIALSFTGGMERMSLDAVATAGVGHLRIAPAGWVDRRDETMRIDSDLSVLLRVRAIEGVSLAAPRAHVGGLLGLGTRSAHVHLTGVDAEVEPQATRYVSELSEGRYLSADERGEVVLGGAIVDRLRARLGDDLLVSVVDAEGEMQSAMLRIVGIVRTGSRTMDLTIAHVTLADVETLSGRPGLSEISIMLEDPDALPEVRAAIGELVAGEDDVLSWMDIADGLRMKIEAGGAATRMAVGLILLVVLLGVASAQLTAVLERRKEFAMLAALGMPGRSLVRVVLTEGMVLGLIGGLLAMAWTAPILHSWDTNGIDIFALMTNRSEDAMAFSGVLVPRFYYPSNGLWVLPTAIGLALVSTVLASLYPALFAARSDPASALRVDR